MGGGATPPSGSEVIVAQSARPSRKQFTVLVTGYGPIHFEGGGSYDPNSSNLVTRQLPTVLPPNSAYNSTSADILILNPTAPDGAYMKVEYAYVRQYAAYLWETYGKTVDLFLHLGAAGGWDFVSVERMAFNERFTSTFWSPTEQGKGDGDGGYYLGLDAAGKTVRDITEEQGKGRWDDAPTGMMTNVEVDDTVRGANQVLEELKHRAERDMLDLPKTVPARAHNEAGSHCCGFIFYESMAHRWRRGLKRTEGPQVAFCHVPAEADDRSIRAAARSVLAVIGSIASQYVK